MQKIGITGGIGMGKSTVADFLSRRGEYVIDTDELARNLVRPDQPAFGEIRMAFGETVISPDGTLNRSALAQLVFGDVEKRKRLEGILHPRIRDAWRADFALRLAENGRRAVVVIPLLFETGAEQELDLVICVACSLRSQRKRLYDRGWSDREIDARSAAQLSVREKMDRAQRVVWTESSREISEMQVEHIFASL